MLTVSMTEETHTNNRHQEPRLLFSELLESGEEIEGLFQQRRRTAEITTKRPSRRISYSSSRNPVSLLREQIATFNKKKDPEFHLHAEGLSFRGQLPFHYYNGCRLITENIPMRNTDTVAILSPILLKTFVPQYDFISRERLEHNCCVILVQGGMERELDRDEKPLAILLDCSTKGLASPSYTFKTSLPLDGSSLSKTSLGESNTSIVRVSSEGSESPKGTLERYKVQADLDHDSICSQGSSFSSTSNLTQSPLTRKKLHKTQSHTNQRKILSQTHSKLSDPMLVGSFSQPTPTSVSPEHRMPKQKFSVGQFMEGVAKSLKSKRKPRPTSIYPEEDTIKVPSPHMSPLNSPTPNDSQFAISTVFHIYYSHAKNAQVYKSVLVSERSTAYEIVKQAMERYGMKFMDPSDFTLYEVIGRWESVADPNLINLESCLGIVGDSPTSSPARNLPLGPNTKIADGSSSNSGVQGKAPPAMEEFNVCYIRKLSSDEQPYAIQLFHLVPDGYTRRFELRSKDSDSTNQGKNGSFLPPTTPVFGATSHRKGFGRQNKLQTAKDSFDFPPQVAEGRGLVSPSNKVLPSSVPDLSLLDCSSPDSGVECLKGSRVSTKSSIASEQSDAGALNFGAYPIPTSCPFLLNLGSGKELLIYRILGDRLVIASSSSDSSSSDSVSSGTLSREDKLELAVPDVSGGKILCTISRELIAGTMKPRSRCLCEPGDALEACPVSLNGQLLQSPVLLRPCDLIEVGERHTFMFQDHTQAHCFSSGSISRRWKPIPSESHSRSTSSSSSSASSPSPKRTGAIIASASSQPSSPRVRELKVAEERLTPAVPGSSEVVVINAGSGTLSSSTTTNHKPISTVKSQPRLLQDKKEPETKRKSRSRQRERCYSDSVSPKHTPSVAGSSYASSSLKHYRDKENSKLTAFPLDRKLMFSYTTSEEDRLLEMLITNLNPVETTFKLAPSFLLAMCIEYSLKCSGPAAASRLACKAVEHIQVAIWESTVKAAEWRPTTTQACYPETVLKTIQPMLSPILFWFANSLELYHFLFSKQDVLDLLLKNAVGGKEMTSEDATSTESNALTMLELMLQHMFQRAFYSISKVLYMLLPCMLDECLLERRTESNKGGSSQALVVSYASEFLKGLLDFMLEVHIHTEMVAQFFANVFFFINATMFNTLVDQGPEMGVLQSKCGSQLGTSLRHLEQWASKVGFRDLMTKYMSRFSAAVALLATPQQDLLQMNWDKLSERFPILHPAQLHFLLSHYSFPKGAESSPAHWSPPTDMTNITEELLHESFSNHPEFILPTDGFVLDLNNPPQDSHLLQEFVENVKKELKGASTKKSVDVVKVDGPQVNVSDIISTSSHQTGDSRDELSPPVPPSKLRGRVKSILEPHSYSSPEKLIISMAEQPVAPVLEERVLTKDHRFPEGSRQVSILRGDTGFGIAIVEGKDRYTGDAAIFIQSVTPNSAAGKSNLLNPGDRVLAIDDQSLRGADYAIAMKYLKEAEEELTIVLAPRNLPPANH